MEWNTKWDLENLDIFNSKPSQISSKKIQTFTDWEMEETDADNASFNLSGACPAIVSASASDVDHISSAKSSVCTDGSSKEGYNKAPEFALSPVDGFSRYFSKPGADLTRTSQSLKTSMGSGGEPLMGLKLGKRTYFENNSGVNYAKTSSVSVIPSSLPSTLKKSKPPNVNATRCQVEGCNLDLLSAKEYHRKHRVCESHSKCPKVIIGGLQRRFCQQCSRFHSLSEFDEKKRSCRRRLSDHNARRRKPQQETIQFNSSGLSSSHYGTQQMSFVLNNPPPQSRAAGNSGWGDTYRSNFAVAKGYPKPEKAGIVDRQHTHFPGVLPSHVMLNHGSSKLLQYKGVNEAFSQGSKESMLSSNLDETTPELHRALSLLSNTSWGSCEPGSVTLDHSSNVKGTNMPQYMMHAVPRGLPLASSECWQTEVQSTDAHMHSLTANSSSGNYYQESQQFTTPFESGFHSDLFS